LLGATVSDRVGMAPCVVTLTVYLLHMARIESGLGICSGQAFGCTPGHRPASTIIGIFVYIRALFRIAPIVLLAMPAFAGEYAILSSGLRLHIDRHETQGDNVRLFTKDGFSEVPTSYVAAFEQEDYVPPPVVLAVISPVETAVAPVAKPAPPDLSKQPDPKVLVHDAAVHYGLPPKFVESVARIESAMRSDAVSPKGALGVMQLMPGTARALNADPTDTAQNIEAGTRLLRELLIKYNNDAIKALAAYNAGEGAVDRYQGLPPYSETQNYVDKVIRGYKSTGGQ
jgi:soluble lytic murein transglycosylase-like protein